MTGYLCAIDVGTTNVKIGMFSPQGENKCLCSREYGAEYPHPGWVEQSPQAIFQAVREVLKQCVELSGVAPGDVLGIALSNQRATFVALDRDGSPLSPYISWQDLRGTPENDWMRERVPVERYRRIAGLDIGTTASVSKILWLQRHHPEVFQATYRFCSMQDMILTQLAGDWMPCDFSTASWYGVFDVAGFDWSHELLDRFGIPRDKLPPLVPPGERVGGLSKAVAEECGLLPGTPLVSGGGDGQCSAVGCGVTRPGLVALVLGTSAVIFSHLDEPRHDPTRALNCVAHAVPRKWELEGSALATGAVYQWYRDHFGQREKEAARDLDLDAYRLFDLEIEGYSPGSSGLLVLPTFMGGGTPGWDPQARGAIVGLTLKHSRRDVLRALVEGIFLELKGMITAVRDLGVETESVRVVGGMAKSHVLRQVLADVTGVKIETPSVSDAALVGAAVCAGLGAGVFSSTDAAVADLVHVTSTYQPDPDLGARYDALFKVYRQTVDLLCQNQIFRQLSDLSNNT